MRAREFSIVEKKRRKRKSRWAAYGPGPYGGYGYLVGYSGDSGGDGGGVGESQEDIKIYMSHDPSYMGGVFVNDYSGEDLSVTTISAKELTGFEPDSKMKDPKSAANVNKIIDGIKRGEKIPPILVRKYSNGYQVLDGHHRFWAHKKIGNDQIPVKIVPSKYIKDVKNKDEIPTKHLGEASYEGNLGMMELAKFFKIADDAKKKLFRDLLEKGKKGLAWKLVQDTTGTKLQGQEFQEDRTADVEFSTGEKKRIRYVPTGKDIVDTLIRYYLKQGLKVVRVDNTKVNWNLAKEEYSYETIDEGWRDTLAGMALGAGVALGSGAAEANVEKVEVSKGDTVYSIAKAFGTTPQIIQKLNKLDKDFTIKPGQTVKVPAADVIDIIDTPSKEKKAEPEKKKESGKKTQSKLDVSKTLTGTTHEAILTKTARAAGITNPIELAAFLAQCAHESHDFKSMVEYGGSLDFRKYDPKYAPRKARALGNTKAGDGARYKGRGYIQLTGRYNYKRAGQALGIPLEKNPQLAEKPEIAAKIAVWFWQQRVQPNVDNFNDVRAVTKPINPGLNGLEDRKEAFVDFKKFKTAQR